MSLQGRTALITGAGSGIGRGLALELANLGATIWVTDYDPAGLEETAEQVRQADAEVWQSQLDVTAKDQIEQLADELASRPVDLLINNAGLQHVAPLEAFPQPTWERLIDVMLNGVTRVTRAILPGMRQRGFGRIINIGSIHSLVASPYKSAYVAAKHGLLGFSKVIALETADTDITINTICPSYVRTPLVDKQIAAQAASHGISESEVIQKIMLEPMPKGAFISYQELGGTIDFLASQSARNITGQSITIDGGWTCR